MTDPIRTTAQPAQEPVSTEWTRYASLLRMMAQRLAQRPPLNAAQQITALHHLADELTAEAAEYAREYEGGK